MLLSVFIIISQLLLGFAVVSWARIQATQLEKFLYTVISGLLIGSWIMFVFNLLLGLNSISIVTGGGLMLLVSCLKLKHVKLDLPWKKSRKLIGKHKTHFIFFAGLLLLSAYLHHTHYLEPKPDGLYSGGGTWGDIAIHMSIINSFVENANRNVEYPVYAGAPLTYNFMVDFSTAVLVAGGLPLRESFLLTGISLLFLTFLIYYVLARNITRNDTSALIATILLLFTGGLGFVYFFEDAQNGAVHNYTNYPEKNLQFWNLVGPILLPQRAYLLGFAAGLLILNTLWRCTTTGNNSKELILAAFLLGLLPLFNWHVFFSVGFVSFTLFLINFYREKFDFASGTFRNWSIFFLIVFMLSLPQAFWTFSQISGHIGKGILALQLGWVSKDNWILFWIMNLGFPFILALPAFLSAKKELKIFYLPFAALFLLANIFRFQAWDLDNLKIFYIWVSLNSILVASFLYNMSKSGSMKRILTYAVIFLSSFSGLLSIVQESQMSWQLFDVQDIEAAKWVRENTPKDAVFLTAPNHNHFVPTLAGRKILMGYEGWLWVYGIDYGQRKKDVEIMFSGVPESFALLKKYRVNYVVVGPKEKSAFSTNETFFDENFDIVKEGTLKIYRINSF